jgi:hypothetical protein
MSQRAADWIGLVLFLAGLIYLGSINFVKAHDHPKQDEALHLKFYRTWMMPDRPTVSCCNDRDCYPTEARKIGDRWEAKRREDGKWLVVPPEKIEQNRDNPDGRNHLCAQPPEHGNGVHCFTLGAGG